jgi:hypothetical protein
MPPSSSDDEPSAWRWVEGTLQAIAMVLCALILLNMAIEDAAHIPQQLCIETAPAQ